MRFIVLLGLLFAPLASCAPTIDRTPVAAENAPGVRSEDYKLGVADKVRVLVFNEPTLSGEFTVNANGSLAIPLIGDVLARDRTTSQVRDDIQMRFADGYLRGPKVSIDVLTFRPFYILGEVNKPGEYPYSSGLTVLNAVATAQGFTYRADRKRVFIKSSTGVTETLRELSSGTYVHPGDTIRIGERYF